MAQAFVLPFDTITISSYRQPASGYLDMRAADEFSAMMSTGCPLMVIHTSAIIAVLLTGEHSPCCAGGREISRLRSAANLLEVSIVVESR